VLACVCEVNKIDAPAHASMGHDHQRNSNSHHGDTHDCAQQCHLSLNELDSGDFIASKNQDVKTPKYESPSLHKEHFYLQRIDHLRSTSEKFQSPSIRLKPVSLQSQNILMQI
ncbi:MAG: hypothetical protein P8H03_04450, partial [Emcibacteraceae bacterium]|nr:hypothetical protein [Emcibacteraceae bacterium]